MASAGGGGFGSVWKQNISLVLEYWSSEDLWNLDHLSSYYVLPAKRLIAYLSTSEHTLKGWRKILGWGRWRQRVGEGLGSGVAHWHTGTTLGLHRPGTAPRPTVLRCRLLLLVVVVVGRKAGTDCTVRWGEGSQWRTAQAWGRTWPPELPSQLFSSLSLWLAHKVGFHTDNFHNQVIAVDVNDIRRCQVSFLWTVWGFWNATKKPENWVHWNILNAAGV